MERVLAVCVGPGRWARAVSIAGCSMGEEAPGFPIHLPPRLNGRPRSRVLTLTPCPHLPHRGPTPRTRGSNASPPTRHFSKFSLKRLAAIQFAVLKAIKLGESAPSHGVLMIACLLHPNARFTDDRRLYYH